MITKINPWIVSFFLAGVMVTLLAMTAAPPPGTEPHRSSTLKVLPLVKDAVGTPDRGEELYQSACAACHGADGTGAPSTQLGFDAAPPDFTDCNFATREPDADWLAVAHQGGPVRGFAREMPAFGDALTEQDILDILSHIRTLCTSDAWPRGELNAPRPLTTEKAFPEDELVVTSSIDLENEGAVRNEIVYEQRFGARNQFEVAIPFGFREKAPGDWTGGLLGDVALGVKRTFYHSIESGSILSLAGEVILPTGDRDQGFGSGTVIFEPFVSFGQILPADAFFHFQGGAEFPLNRDKATEEVFFRGALGRSFTQGPWGRSWSPMVEVLGARELASGEELHWDLVPQMQVSLNTRQHITLNAGVRLPVDGSGRDTQFVVYLLWEWFDGGFLEGW